MSCGVADSGGDGGAVNAKIEYFGQGRSVAPNDGLLRTKSVFDGFGREVESQQHNGTAWVVTKKVYDGAHRVWKAYNPTTGDAIGVH